MFVLACSLATGTIQLIFAQSVNEDAELKMVSELFRGPLGATPPVKADVYLYDVGIQNLPEDLHSSQMDALFQQAIGVIEAVVSTGAYTHFEYLIADVLTVPPDCPEPTWIWLAMRYRQKPTTGTEVEEDRLSPLAMRAEAKYIHKVRSGHVGSSLSIRRLSTLLWGWRHSVCRVANGQPANLEEDELPDEQWTRILAKLQTPALPHALGFFDQVDAEARQSAALAQHFSGDVEVPEVELEGDDVRDAYLHETAHAVFSFLEKQMKIDLHIGGFAEFVDEN